MNPDGPVAALVVMVTFNVPRATDVPTGMLVEMPLKLMPEGSPVMVTVRDTGWL